MPAVNYSDCRSLLSRWSPKIDGSANVTPPGTTAIIDDTIHPYYGEQCTIHDFDTNFRDGTIRPYFRYTITLKHYPQLGQLYFCGLCRFASVDEETDADMKCAIRWRCCSSTSYLIPFLPPDRCEMDDTMLSRIHAAEIAQAVKQVVDFRLQLQSDHKSDAGVTKCFSAVLTEEEVGEVLRKADTWIQQKLFTKHKSVLHWLLT